MGQSFTTDANAWTLSGVTLALANPSATSKGSFAVGLYGDNGGTIGSLIGSLTTTQTSFFTNPIGNRYSFQNILFTNDAITLAASTKYWVGISNPETSFYAKQLYGVTATGVGTYGTGFIDTQTFSASNPLNVTVTGTAVPEPSTYALFGIGAIGMLMVMRRKKTA
jgi:hypothetical protein